MGNRGYFSTLSDYEISLVEKVSAELVGQYEEIGMPLNLDNVTYLTERSSPDILKFLEESHPSDMLEITKDFFSKLSDIIKQVGWHDKLGCPSDLWDSGLVPMEDVLMHVPFDDTDEDPVDYRVVVHDKTGYLVFSDYSFGLANDIVVPLLSKDGSIILDPARMFMLESSLSFSMMTKMRYDPNGTMFVRHIYDSFDTCLKLWYAFEACLLNPDIRESIMKKVGKEKLNGKCMTGKKKDGRTTKYVKRLRPDANIFKSSDGNSFERKTMAWYVIGHWREYSNGKRIFIKPYWKGPLRQARKNLDSGRIRKI